MEKNLQEVMLQFCQRERTGVLAVEMLDGSPHGATLHFACVEESFCFVFLTHLEYRKCEPIKKKTTTRGTFVVGTTEDDMKTLQLDGEIKILKDEKIKEIYFLKFPEKAKKYNTEKDIFLVLTPSWWRFTDWNYQGQKTMLYSSGEIIN